LGSIGLVITLIINFVGNERSIVISPQKEVLETQEKTSQAKPQTQQKKTPTNSEGNVNFAIAPQFHYAYDFSEGLAKVKVDGKYGYIDTTGKLAIAPQFHYAYNFSEGLAKVKVDGIASELYSTVLY
jgi:hypothetical protein